MCGMKIVRVPWILCRADEVDTIECEMEWHGRVFAVMAYSEAEARKWWVGTAESEKRALLGFDAAESDEGLALF